MESKSREEGREEAEGKCTSLRSKTLLSESFVINLFLLQD